MTPTLPQLIAELKAVEAKATKGPWLRDRINSPDMQIIANGNEVVAYHFRHQRQIDARIVPNFDLIALSRTILPHLIAVVEKQAEELKLWRDQDFAAQDKGGHCKEDPCPICTAAVDTDASTQSLLAALQDVKETA